jgi:hypothetical protein
VAGTAIAAASAPATINALDRMCSIVPSDSRM